jgi:HlyD family secretion protein
MRTLAAALIGVALLPASLGERRNLPTLRADLVTSREVRRAAQVGIATELAESEETLLVERPAHAVESTTRGVFIVSGEGVLVRRAVTYGRASGTLIQVVSGVAPGDRVVVSDMSAWDAFDRVRLRR